MTRWMHFFACLLLLSLAPPLSGCTPGSYDTPRSTAGIVTDDPSKLPDVSWQTAGQRESLLIQNKNLSASSTPAPAPAPSGTAAKVALLVPLSGKHAALGQAMFKAAQLALFDVGSHNFELIPADTQSTASGAAAAAQQAVADGASLILGPIFAEDAKAAQHAVTVPLVTFSTDWTLADTHTYVFGFTPFQQVDRVVTYAQSRGLARLAVIAPQSDYANMIVSGLPRLTQPVATLRYTSGQTDLSAQIAAFVAAQTGADGALSFDSLLLPVGGENLRNLTAQLDQHGIRASRARFIGTGLWDDAATLSDPTLTGAWFAAPDPAARLDFERRYQQTFGNAPPRLATLAYDATALAAVLARSDTSGTPFSRDRLIARRGFAGIDGVFRFRSDGLAERGLAVVELTNGRTRVIDPAPTAFAGQ